MRDSKTQCPVWHAHNFGEAKILEIFFGFFLCNITKITQNECFLGLLGKYAAAGNRLIDFDLEKSTI